jgi:hypothetical protein
VFKNKAMEKHTQRSNNLVNKKTSAMELMDSRSNRNDQNTEEK